MTDQILAFVSWFERRPARERLILALTAVAVVVFLFEVLWWVPAREQLGYARDQITSLENEKSMLSNELLALEQREALDPDAALRQQLDVVQRKIASLDEELRGQTLQILPPQQMPVVLRDLIDTTDSLRIVGIRSEPPQRLVEGIEDNQTILYRHGLVLDLKGEYLALLDCVRALEALPWRFYWLGIEVHAEGNRTSDFRLHVYTVSLREEWIRV